MLAMSFALQSITPEDVAVGVALDWPIYDTTRRLVLNKGQMIKSPEELTRILGRGAFRAVTSKGANDADASKPAGGAQAPLPEGTSLESLHLSPGDQFQLQSTANSDRLYVRLIGYLPQSTIIVTTPQRDRQVMLMREGQAFIVRAFSGKQAFGFNTSVRRVCNVPYPYLHLEYPERIEGMTIRTASRVRTRLICTVARPEAPEKSVAAVISDLSATGARIDSAKMLAEKSEIVHLTFRFKRNEDEALFVVNAIVRSVRDEPAAEGGTLTHHHGVEFVEMPRNEQLLLKTLVYEMMSDGTEI
jgi:hypothetical protein